MSDFEQKHAEALTALRQEVEKSAPNQELIKKCNDFLDKQEAKNQEITLEIAEQKKIAKENEEKMASLEAELKRAPNGSSEQKAKSEEVKSFENFLRNGKIVAMNTPSEAKYLRTDVDAEGGYLAPVEYVNEIIKNITEISPIRSIARTIRTSRKEIEIPKRTSLISGGWVGEGATASASNSTYGMESLKAHKMMVYTDITMELLSDSVFNMRQEIASDIGEDFAKIEGAAFVNGNGVAKPEGLLTKAGITERNSGNATSLEADCLFEVQGDIKEGYELTALMNRRTLHQHIRTLKDGQGRFLLQQGLGSLPNTIAGLPYVIANDMPDVAAGTFPIMVGDFYKAYTIVDNQNISMIDDHVTQATAGKHRIIAYKRTGGQVTLGEALAKIKIAV